MSCLAPQIETLYNEMENIKQLQSVLNHELDFVNSHQQEINQYIDQVKAKATANPQDKLVWIGRTPRLCDLFQSDWLQVHLGGISGAKTIIYNVPGLIEWTVRDTLMCSTKRERRQTEAGP